MAVVLAEPDRELLVRALGATDSLAIGAPTLVESGLALAWRIGPGGLSLAARFVQQHEIEILPFDERHWPVALDAFLRFGKGRHPAALNLGDCLSYASARIASEPLLCLGDDFAQTDLELVRLDSAQ